MQTEQGQVKLPREFFQRAKDDYRDWRWSFIRELVQNSYDAQASNIRFTVHEEAGTVVIGCDDDGVGMSKDTLINVLLCMGGSYKATGAIGGKGVAKTLLFFAHERYSIRTGPHVVEGAGGDYEYHAGAAPLSPANPGVAIQVAMYDQNAANWRSHVTRYAARCFMEYATGRPVILWLDGVELDQDTSTYDYEVEDDFGTVWYDEAKGVTDSTFMVTVGGLPMFQETVYAANSVALNGIIDLKPGSVSLTANRDGLTGDSHQRFHELVARLIGEHNRIKFGHAVEFSLNLTEGFHGQTARCEDGIVVPSLDAGSLIRFRDTSSSTDQRAFQDVFARIRQSAFPRNFHLKVESLAMRKNAKGSAYITATEFASQMGLHRNHRLSRAWKLATSIVLNTQYAIDNGVRWSDRSGTVVVDWEADTAELEDMEAYFDGHRIDTGFCFTREAAALCSKTNAEGEPHRIYINPLDLTVDAAVRWHDMLDLAFHEATHLWVEGHGETFCDVEMKLRKSMHRYMSEKELVAWIDALAKSDKPI